MDYPKFGKGVTKVMKRVSVWAFSVVGVAALACVGIGAAAQDDGYNANAALVHVGMNPPECGGPTLVGSKSGVVSTHFNQAQKRLKITVSVHDALPNTTYVVDIRCNGAIGALTTDSTGTGLVEINLFNDSAPANFYIDISVPNVGGGYANYGDTFVAGPFNLN